MNIIINNTKYIFSTDPKDRSQSTPAPFITRVRREFLSIHNLLYFLQQQQQQQLTEEKKKKRGILTLVDATVLE